MQQKWTLKIEEFAKIKEAKIEISPFLVFIGENNSGKSYIMTLLWGLFVLGRTLFPLQPPKNEAYQKCINFLDEKTVENEYKMSAEDMELFIQFYNNILKDKKNYLLKKLFVTNCLSIKTLEIINYQRKEPLTIKFIEFIDNKQRISSGKNYVKFPLDKKNITNDQKYKIVQYICWKLLMEDLTAPLFSMFDKKRINGEPIFLPASRTGFMLTYKSLIADVMINSWGYDKKTDINFTLPIVKFLQALIEQKESKKKQHEDVINLLENEIINGQIISKEEIINEYSYKQKGMKKDIPLHITSSLVVELAPLLIFLKSNLKYKSIFIEELEAHLHPKIQKLVTRAIIKLMNKKLPVVITTHSDTIFQHINNMIKLSNIKNKKDLMDKLGYDKDDLIHKEDIKVYEFKVTNNQTEVIPLTLTDEGFEVPSFNNALIELAEETITLSESLND